MTWRLSKRLAALVLAVAICISRVPLESACAQDEERDEKVARLMASMTSAAKVGQLFLVTFPGTEVTDDAAITELIRDYHVGGVMLRPENGNIINEGETPKQVATLIGQLQETSWENSQPANEMIPGEEPFSQDPFVPLFVAVKQHGDGEPYTSIISGMTDLPSQMALGATWNLSHTETIGQIFGEELHALGINMLLGPSLDVLEKPHPESAGDPGVSVFGGEPFWVGEMGKAYIQGIQQGSEGHVAAVAQHFPGLGSSERALDEEISTVQRTLEKLRQVDLAPFFAVAQADNQEARPDGIMISHIRFRGLEGGRFITTRPISVDSQVLQKLMALPELASWREQGGVTVSDELGLRGLQRFYNPNEESFNGRRIAQDAFLAGNDLLLLSKFGLSDSWEEQISNVKSTITFFHERYENDPAFQASVDKAVERILRLKLDLYDGTFSLPSTQPNAERVDKQVGTYQTSLSSIARDAVTLLSPPSADLVPSPPTSKDNIVIFTDNQTERPCSTCSPIPYIEADALRNTILRLYGPEATRQVNPEQISSFTLAQLEAYMQAPPPSPTPTPSSGEVVTSTPTLPRRVETALQNADWLIFGMLDSSRRGSQPGTVQHFLAEYADVLRDRNLIVLAYDAPYYLDATEIDKLSAYYVTYSHAPPFIEASVRALFGESAPGAPPVSVAGINYDLSTQTSPDPEQSIPLYYEVSATAEEQQGTPESASEEQSTPTPTEEEQPTPEPTLEIGDQLKLYTGMIVDHNGNPVPDGTPVQFIFSYPQEGLEQSKLPTTHNGVAETKITADRTGQLDIFIQADPVPRTIALQIMIEEGEPATIVTPTPTITPSPTATATSEVEPTIEKDEETPTPTSTPTPASKGVGSSSSGTNVMGLVLALVGVLLVSSSGYYVMRLDNRSMRWALRVALWCAISGLALYIAYALLPLIGWGQETNVWTAGGAALVGSVIALSVAWAIKQRWWLKRDSKERG